MRTLIEQSDMLIDKMHTNYVRDLLYTIKWDYRLIGIKGSRGAGKTTLLLQYLKLHPELNALYVSMDDLYFGTHTLLDLASRMAREGWTHLFADEVHLYANWSQEVKLIYDRYPELHVVFTGSSLLSIAKGKGDLSRRAHTYTMYGLSFREYLNLTYGTDFQVLDLASILKNHRAHARSIRQKIKPLAHLDAYMEKGYYPFFLEDPDFYLAKLRQSTQVVLDVDLPYAVHVEIRNVHRLKQLLQIVAESVPFTPNIKKLSERLNIDRNSLKFYLHHLHEAMLIHNLYSGQKGISQLTKPEKVYLQNPNLFFALAEQAPERGSLRESFVLSHVAPGYRVHFPKKGDFLVDNRYLLEVGGRNKTREQVKAMDDAYLVKDDVETGYGNEIPLWLFGFLY